MSSYYSVAAALTFTPVYPTIHEALEILGHINSSNLTLSALTS